MLTISNPSGLEHQGIRLIPKDLWESFIFNSQISNVELRSMTEDLAAIDKHQSALSTHDSDSQLRSWICLLLGHQWILPTDLLLIAQKLPLSPDIIFKGALLAHRLDIIDEIETNIPTIKSAIADNDYFIFRCAARMGHLDSLKKLTKIAPEKKINMIRAGDYRAFSNAAYNGHFAVLKWIKQKRRLDVKHMIESAFFFAASGGRIDVLEWLKSQWPRQFKTMVAAYNYGSFSMGASQGHVAVLNWFKTNAPNQLQAMVEADHFGAFRKAAANGHLTVLNWFRTAAPTQFQAMIEADRFDAFRSAAANGHLTVLNWFKAEAPTQFQAMKKAYNFDAFRTAVSKGNIKVLNWFKKDDPALFQTMVKADHWDIFLIAIKNGQLESLKWLKAEAPDQFQAMVEAKGSAPYALAEKYPEISSYLLSYPNCFISVPVEHQKQLIIAKLDAWHKQQQATLDNPHAVFKLVDLFGN